MAKGELGVSVNRLLKLSELCGISLEDMKTGIKSALVGRLTLINDKNFVNFVLNLKTNSTNLCS